MFLRTYIQKLRSKGAGYWVRLAGFLAAGVLVGSWVGQWDGWIDARYQAYRELQHVAPRTTYQRDTAFVLIEDDDYWKGGLRRIPMRRDYLARLINALDSVEPAVIVLDIDLRASLPDAAPGVPLEPAFCHSETKKLVRAIKAVSLRRPIVIPKTVNNIQGKWIHESDVLDDFNLGKGRVVRGYDLLPKDKRRIPMSVSLPDGPLDSLSLAAAKAKNKHVAQLADSLQAFDEAPFAGYLDKSEFEEHIVASGKFLRDPQSYREQLMSRIVIIGGAWSQWAYARGTPVDTHSTPAGPLVGAVIHANYIEAFLDGRIYTPTKEWIALSIEGALVVLVAFSFLDHNPIRKAASVLTLCLIAVVISYIALINLGVFFDFLIPLLAVALHSVLEQILEWWADARRYRQLLENGPILMADSIEQNRQSRQKPREAVNG